MCVDDDLRKTIEEAASAARYSVGASDAIARLLALIARHQGLDLNADIPEVMKMANMYHRLREADRINGFENVVSAFRHEFNRK